MIFDTLNFPELANDAWELIIKLPTNPLIHQQVLNLQVSWEALFDASSIHKLLYTL